MRSAFPLSNVCKCFRGVETLFNNKELRNTKNKQTNKQLLLSVARARAATRNRKTNQPTGNFLFTSMKKEVQRILGLFNPGELDLERPDSNEGFFIFYFIFFFFYPRLSSSPSASLGPAGSPLAACIPESWQPDANLQLSVEFLACLKVECQISHLPHGPRQSAAHLGHL